MTTIKKYDLKLKSTNTRFQQVKIVKGSQAADYIRNFYLNDIVIFESFFLLLLNSACQTIGYVKISQGGVAGTVVDPKIVAKYAIDSLAQAVILAHNHPSGNIKPSEKDIVLTEKIKDGLKLLDIDVVDHIIITEDNYFSFQEEGLI